MFVKRTSITLKKFRSKLTIKTLSLGAISLVIKFGWIANTSRPNKTGSWRQSSLSLSNSALNKQTSLQTQIDKKIKDPWRFSRITTEKDTIRKGWVDKNITELDADNEGGEYKVETICNNAVYAKKLELGHFLKLYYLIFWKDYQKEENI